MMMMMMMMMMMISLQSPPQRSSSSSTPLTLPKPLSLTMTSSLPLAFLLLISLSLYCPPPISADSPKEVHLHFYFHDIVVGVSPTAVRVAQAPIAQTSLTGFGSLVMIDDALTEGPDRSSKLLGYAEGMYGLASKEEFGLLMTMNLHFVDGDYNGSTLAVLGRNAPLTEVREMPVVGGSGKFRFARGYVLAKTYDMSILTGNAVVEYNVTVRLD